MSAKARTAALAAVILGAGLFVFGLVTGLVYEQVNRARDRADLPQIGRSVDIGGRALNLYCSGTGQPAVILESGATWPLHSPKEIWANGGLRPGLSWVSIQRELSQFTTACWYDRAGSGWSDLGPYPRDSAAQARDLHALLQAAAVPAPYVLVAESSAALDARVYTGLYPADVAGLIFVNGVHPDFFIGPHPGARRRRFPAFVGRSQDASAQVFNRIGLYRLGPATPQPDVTPHGMTPLEWNTIWRLSQSAKARSALIQEISAWEQSTSEARAADSPGDRPLLVLSSDSALPPAYRELWNEQQDDLARLSTRGKRWQLDRSAGDPLYQAPGSIIGATREVLADVRRSAPPRQ